MLEVGGGVMSMSSSYHKCECTDLPNGSGSSCGRCKVLRARYETAISLSYIPSIWRTIGDPSIYDLIVDIEKLDGNSDGHLEPSRGCLHLR